jgi:hypothetical protein
MTIEQLMKLGAYTRERLDDFYNEFKNEDINGSTNEDWNARDVLGHLGWWVRFAATKLENIKSNVPHSAVTNLIEFNRNTFDSYKNISIHIVYHELISALDYFVKISLTFSETELPSKEFPIGFKYELWSYMELHLFAHHFIHILPFYLKKGNHQIYIKVLDESEADILEWSNNTDVLLLKEYITDSNLLKQRLFELHEYNQNNSSKAVDTILKINLEIK